MKHREPPDVAVMAARVARAYPTLSPYSAASIATELCRIERLTHLHAERQCNDPDYQDGMARWKRGRNAIISSIARVNAALRDQHCRTPLESEVGGDPRGATFKVRLPGEKELVAV